MFESLEDLVEISVNLNYKLYPIILGMTRAYEKNPSPEFAVIHNDLIELLNELQNFLTKLEAVANEEGGLDLNDFEERKVH